MALVTLSIGSNTQRTRHISACLDALLDTFGKLSASRVYESKPVGLKRRQISANFYNLAVALECDWPVERLQTWCKALEARQGRGEPCGQAPRSNVEAATHLVQPLDVDILSVGALTGIHGGVELPRRDMLRHAFVLRPLAELLPEQRHPLSQRRYAALWQEFDAASQPLWPVAFEWRYALPYFAQV